MSTQTSDSTTPSEPTSRVVTTNSLPSPVEQAAILMLSMDKEAAAGVPHVARVYTRDAILTGAVPREAISERITRAYHRDRSGDLMVLLEPHWIAGGSTATHGTPYGYDAHVPLILMGPGIVSGRYRDRAALNDLAPTLAAVLDVEPPSGASGRVLSEALRADAPPGASRTPAAFRSTVWSCLPARSKNWTACRLTSNTATSPPVVTVSSHGAPRAAGPFASGLPGRVQSGFPRASKALRL